MYTLTKADVHGVAQPMAVHENQRSELTLSETVGTVTCSGGKPGQGYPAVMQPIGSVAYGFEPGIAKREGNPNRFGEEMSPTLRAHMGDNQAAVAVVQPVAYNISPGKGVLKDDIHVTLGDVSKTLDASGSNPEMHQGGSAVVQPVGVDIDNTNLTGDCSGNILAGAQMRTNKGMGVMQPVAPTLTAANNPSRSPQSTEITNQVAAVYSSSMAVRRLTPRECERLQGFRDDYTLIPWRGKEAPDGPRYKALGNSMAVPVMRWIGERINALLPT